MSRPIKCRKIENQPRAEFFKPAGIPLHHLEQVDLTVDELEAVRLADLEGFYQDRAAEQMNISRQTFGNILNSAHRKIADAIVNAKAVRIGGGVITWAARTFTCSACHHQWSLPCGTGGPENCPACGGGDITCDRQQPGKSEHRCRKHCRRNEP
jgi:uncharacterized protein